MPIEGVQGWQNVKAYGAIGDGKASDTKSIQATIDACEANGGGFVIVPPGTYVCGTLVLKSNITFQISFGATLLYNPENADFFKLEVLPYKPYADLETSYFHFALFMGEGIQNIVLQGGGVIENAIYKRPGPKPIALKQCNNITVRDLTIKNAPNYAISLMDCENITIENVKIIDAQADGIDFDNSRYGRVSNCYVDAFDDAICLKTSLALGRLSTTSNISISNCSLGSSCNCIKLGTESNGDFSNIAVSNCTFFTRAYARKAISGLAIESVDGAKINNISIDNIVMQGANCPIFLRLGYRGRGKNPMVPGTLKNVLISNIIASNATFPCVFAGIRDHPISDINLDNIRIEYSEMRETPRETIATEIYARDAKPKSGDSLFNVPEAARYYPEADMFGTLPAWGIYGRHLNTFKIINITFNLIADTYFTNIKSSIIFEYIKGLELDGINILFAKKQINEKIEFPELEWNAIWFNQASYVNLKNFQKKYSRKTGIRISGNETKAIIIETPKFERVIAVKIDEEVPYDEVVQRWVNS